MPLIHSLFLVDDDPDDQQLFIEALGSVDNSVAVKTASNGVDALELLLRNHPQLPDLILLDLNMPKMNGKQFLQALKASENFHTVPVVIYTTSSNHVDKYETRKMGAADFIVKPFRFTELCDFIKYILGRTW